MYLDGSKAATSGSGLTFDGTNLGIGTSSPTQKLHVVGNIDAVSSSNVGSAGSAIYYLGGANAPTDAEFKYNTANRNLTWKTAAAGTDMLTLDSSGSLGLGVTPSVWTGLGVVFETVGGALTGQGTNNISLFQNTYYSSGFKYKTSGFQASYYQQNSGQHQWFNAPSGTAGTAISFTQAMTLDASGNLLVGATSVGGYGWTFASAGYAYTARTGTVSQDHILFKNGNGIVGAIGTNGTATYYNTSSDYRLKNTIAPMQNALAKVAQLKPVTYKWNADDSDGQGFIAHELQAVIPESVTGEKDAVDDEGNPVYQGIDPSKIVATLTAAIQELKAELDELKSQLGK